MSLFTRPACAALTLSLLLVACGGGGGGSASSTDPGTTTVTELDAPPASGTPSATLSRSQSSADGLAGISADGAQSLAIASSVSGVG